MPRQQSHWDAITALTAVLKDADCAALSDEELLNVTRYGAEERRPVDAVCAVAAGEIARRPTPELGSTGQAQRTGHRTIYELVHITTEATTLDADRLAILARQVRDEIDETGITDRERAQHTARSLRLLKRTGGMTRLVWVMDPETATTTDSTQLLGSGAPVVRVLVAAKALHAGARHDTPKRSPSIRTGLR